MRELKGDWRDLFACFMIGLDLRKLLMAFIGGAATVLAVGIVTFFFGNKVDPRMLGEIAPGGDCPVLPSTVNFFLFHIIRPSLAAIFSSPGWAIAYLLVILPIISAIWSYFGGAITRIASIEIAKDERIETEKALEFVQGRYGSYFWSLVATGAGFLLFFLVNVVVASVGRWWLVGSLFQPLLMLLLPLALLSGFIMVLIAIGAVFGYPLFYPAISAEGTDSFDAISRGFSYVYSKPWHYILYQVITALYGAVSIGFVMFFGWLMIKLTILSCGVGIGADQMAVFVRFATGDLQLTGAHSVYADATYGGFFATLAAIIFTVWLVIVWGFVSSYAISFFLSSQTMLYFLLRKQVDGIEMNEVYEERMDEPAPLPKPASPAGEAKPAEGGAAGATGGAAAAAAAGPATPPQNS